MKIVYVGQLDPTGTCYSRFEALRAIEPDIHPFNSDEVLGWNDLSSFHRAFENHLLNGPRLRRANAELIARCEKLNPDMVWIDTGDWIRPATLETLASQGRFLVHHMTDALEAKHWRVRLKRRLLNRNVTEYDAFLTTNINDHQALSGSSKPVALLTDLGYDHRRFDATPLSQDLARKWDNDIVFIGHYEANTEAGIIALIEAGLPVTVYGNAHWFASPHRKTLGDRLQPALGDEDYENALKGAKIGLCIVSVLNYNQTASRSFEIPGSGTFLLAIRTPQHLDCYEEGKEAEFFSDHGELIQKARHYLEHSEEREAIAKRGLERCLASGYSWEALMAKDWIKVKQLFADRSAG